MPERASFPGLSPMTINFLKKICVLCSAWRETFRMPGFKKMAVHLVNPVDSVRYTEFAYLLGFLGERLKGLNVLDVSSPHVLSYMLSRHNNVVKTNIDETESRLIHESENLKFRHEDALALSFPDETFDLTYSISVVEHIYLKYTNAVREMLRVTKDGGYVYLTFSVSAAHTEEWLPYPMYPAQKKAENGFFFQYRFGKSDIDALLAAAGGAEVAASSIYWERHDGAYDRLTSAMRKNYGAGVIYLLRNALLNLYAGFFLLENRPGNFKGGRAFGNISIILKKRG